MPVVARTYFVDTNLAKVEEIKHVLRNILHLKEQPGLSYEHTVVMLPATERHKRWSHLQVSGRGNNFACQLSMQEIWPGLGGQPHWVHREIDQFVYGYILSEARARTHRKRLPGYHEVHSFWNGVAFERSLEVSIDVISQGPPSMDGVYVRLSAIDCGPATGPELDRVMAFLDKGAFETRSLYEILQGLEPDFPFLWADTPVRIISRGDNHPSFNLTLKVPAGSTARQILDFAKITKSDHPNLEVKHVEREEGEQFTSQPADLDTVVQEGQTIVLVGT